MRETYFNELTELFSNSNFDEQVYNQIIDKYKDWYDKLLFEGKSDEEIQVLLKSPSEVFDLFSEKYKPTVQYNTEDIIDENNIQSSTQTIIEEDCVEEVDNNVINDDILETATTKDTVGDNSTTYNPEIDPSIIVKTNAKGKRRYYKKRSFMGGVGVFLLSALVSVIVFPVLLSIFSMFLSSGLVSLGLVFMPIQYIVFVNRYDTISYITPDWITSFQQRCFDKFGAVPDLPANFMNDVNNAISQINQHTFFEFGMFLHTIIIALFAFALLLLFLYLTIQSFKLIINYFSMLINKIRFKKIDL